MRKVIRWSFIPLAVAAAACNRGGQRARDAMADDLKRDLQLATASQNGMRISPDEISPQSHPAEAVSPKRAPGPKVIRTNKPTVKASRAPSELAQIKSDVPQVQAMASATAPAATPTATPSPDPAPPLARPGAGGDGGAYPGNGPGEGNTGIGGGGGIFGGIGGVGDDHCEPRGGRRGGVYGPMVGGFPIPIPMGIPRGGRGRP